MNEMDIATYLLDFCDKLEEALPQEVYSCRVYGGELDNDSTDYLNFQVNKKTQCFITLRNIEFQQGSTLMGDAYFIVAIAALPDRKTDGYSLLGISASQKIMGFINNSDCFSEGTAGRPTIVDTFQKVNKIKEKKLYNIFHVVYKQRIILKQN
jgi:hypothetical protein